MLVQEIDSLTSSVWPAARVPQAAPAQPWRCLPIKALNNFEWVDRQFAAYQVWFESAIAVRPSNPQFHASDRSIALMPASHEHSLKISVGEAVTEIDIGLISSRPVTLSLLDDQGHCRALVNTITLPSTPVEQSATDPKYPIQGITLNTHNATTLRIDAKEPFIMTHFLLK
ncbi:MAG: hypothetical protein ACFB0G_20710 [Leptolyngbyaceae cyanobacterium]